MKFNRNCFERLILRSSGNKVRNMFIFRWIPINTLFHPSPIASIQICIILKFPIVSYAHFSFNPKKKSIIRKISRIIRIVTINKLLVIIYPIKAKLFLSPNQTGLLKFTRDKISKDLSPIRVNYNNKCLIPIK